MWRKGWTPAGADEATTLCNACGILCVPLASPGFAPPRDFSEPTPRFGSVSFAFSGRLTGFLLKAETASPIRVG